jgi:N,N'-diacetyllegionaminate synthase
MSGDNVFIIAEAGVNHNGDMSLAKELIHAAAESGADAVKFQTFNAERLVSQKAPKAQYQLEQTDSGESQLAMLKKLELPYDQHSSLKELSEKLNIEFMSTPFDMIAADFLKDLGVRRFKIPSGEITNFPYLRHVARLGLPVIFSTGMSDLNEVGQCLHVLTKYGISKNEITVLHCNTEYPTPFNDVNLRVMETIRKEFGVSVGYSDHTAGIDVSLAAAALGASLIEKHFTMSRELPGPDHKASLEPYELQQMVRGIRNISAALGSDVKRATTSEAKNIHIARKSLVALKAIKKGEVFTEQNLTTKRPGNGISPMRWEEFIGKVSEKDYLPDDLI